MNEYHGIYGISLIFAPGRRPDEEALHLYSQESLKFAINPDISALSKGETISPAAGDDSSLALELLIGGLTFDIIGLAPGLAAPLPTCSYKIDLKQGFDITGCEALRIEPGPHLQGGERIIPIVRAMAELAAALCALPNLLAVAWHPAKSCIQPAYFASVVANWLDGGVFPAHGLVGLTTVADGALQSEGVAFFTGQELRIEPELMDDPAVANKIAVRLIDHLVTTGPLDRLVEIGGPDGRLLRVEPSENGRLARVWGAS